MRRALAFLAVFLVVDLIVNEGFAAVAGEPLSYWSRIIAVAAIAVLITIAFDRWWPRNRPPPA